MADNINITQGSGTTMGTKDIGGTHYQRIMNGFLNGSAFADVSEALGMPVRIKDIDTPPTTSYNNLSVTNGSSAIKSSAGKIYSGYAFNSAATTRYLRFYDATAVTVGTTTKKNIIPIPAGSSIPLPIAPNRPWTFATGICAAATQGAADNNTSLAGANEVILSLEMI